jgi:glutamine amidotransferase/cyclase
LAIPVIGSSGAGREEHFSEVFKMSKAEANLIAGIFHREELHIEALKKHLRDEGRDEANLQIWKRRAISGFIFLY